MHDWLPGYVICSHVLCITNAEKVAVNIYISPLYVLLLHYLTPMHLRPLKSHFLFHIQSCIKILQIDMHTTDYYYLRHIVAMLSFCVGDMLHWINISWLTTRCHIVDSEKNVNDTCTLLKGYDVCFSRKEPSWHVLNKGKHTILFHSMDKFFGAVLISE